MQAGLAPSPSLNRRLTLGLLLVALACAAFASPALAGNITNASGPLTRINISTDLNCQVYHTGDQAGEFYPTDDPGDCATLITSGGTLYGPSGIAAGAAANPRTPYTQVSQSATTGTGTAANPYKIVTIVNAGTSGLRLEETDSYVAGDEAYRTDVKIVNTTNAVKTGILYRAGDCFLQDSDEGFGRVDGSAISCVGDDASQAGDQPGSRIEQFLPITGGSAYYEAGFSQVWAKIGTQAAFPNTCRCTEFIDNGAGLSWAYSVAPNSSTTISNYITFSPLGRQPLQTSKTANSSTATAGGNDGYAITISNPNTVAATLNSITDTLPAGFSYQAGTTQEPGGGTDNPSISGQQLTFNGPYSVPAGGSVTLRFGVTVSTTPGTYNNNAGGDSSDFTVIPTGPTAPVTVSNTGPPPAQGRMAGEGRLIDSTKTLDYAYVIKCDPAQAPQFRGSMNGQAFNVSDITANSCTDDPSKSPAKPGTSFDTMEGDGTGTLGSTNVKVHFKFVDGGVDGNGDSAQIVIRNASTNAVLFTSSAAPIPAYGGGTRAGRNTAENTAPAS
jgi:uncharacterized repeat protein (TIGR01451 family)